MKLPLPLIFLSLFTGQLTAQSAADQILALDQALEEAEARKDFEFLERNIADDYVWTPRSGNQMDKKTYIGRLRDGRLLSAAPGASITRENVRVRVFGETAVVTAVSNYKSDAQALRISQTAVFAKLGGRWQLVAAHSSVPPAP